MKKNYKMIFEELMGYMQLDENAVYKEMLLHLVNIFMQQDNTQNLQDLSITWLQNEADSTIIHNAGELNNGIMKNKYLKMHKIPIKQGPTQSNGKPGKWCTRLPNGKQIHRVRKEDAEKEVIDYYIAEEERKNTPKLTLNNIFNDYFKHRLATVNTATVEKDMRHFKYYIKNTNFANKELSEITINEIKVWAQNIIQENKMTPKYFSNVVGTLNTMLNYLADECNLSASKLTNIDLKTMAENLYYNNINTEELEALKKEKKEGRNLYKDEIEQFESYINQQPDDEIKVISLGLLLILELGLRVGELCAIKYSDFSIKARNLHLCRRMIAHKEVNELGKNDYNIQNNGFIVVPKLKNRKESRDISITDNTIIILEEIRRINTKLGYPVGDDDYVFWRKNSETGYKIKLCTIRVFDNRIRTICKKCGFKHIYSCHDLRRTYATLLKDLGYDVDQIQSQMGHNDAKTTQKYIGKLYPDDDSRNDILKNLSSTMKKIS